MRREMMLHELHPSVVHLPIGLVPVAVATDWVARTARDPSIDRLGRAFWLGAGASALFAAAAGLTASQEVRMHQRRARDMTFVHGTLNLAATALTTGLALWRTRHPPTVATGVLGLATCGVVLYTATLGGKMVYELGIGINPMPPELPNGTRKGPLLLSREAPATFAREAVQGLGWLVARARRWLAGREPLAPGATALRAADVPRPWPEQEATRATFDL